MRGLLVLVVGALATKAPPAILAAIDGCARLEETTRVLDVATASMVVGASCDSDDCCWPMAGTNELLDVNDADGLALESIDSKAILKYYSKGLRHKNNPHLIESSLLFVLFAIDPSSFFIAFRTSDRKLEAVAQPTSAVKLEKLVKGIGLPQGVNAPELILLLHIQRLHRRALAREYSPPVVMIKRSQRHVAASAGPAPSLHEGGASLRRAT